MKRTIQDDLSMAMHVLLCMPFVSKVSMADPELWADGFLVKIEIVHKWYIRWFANTKQYDELASHQIQHMGDWKIIFEINGVRHPPF